MRSLAPALCLIALTGTASAQYVTLFDGLAGSAAGTPCAGQDGFYVPPVAGSIDGNIHTYAGNTLGVPVNVNGGSNFWGGLPGGGTAFARSQRAITLPSGRVRVEHDICCNFLGAALPTNNLGSFSFQPSTASLYANVVAAYTAPIAFPHTAGWGVTTVSRGATPPATVTAVIPDPAFSGLAMAVWHRWGFTADFTTQTYVDFSITNGVTGITTVWVPPTPMLLPVAPAVGAPLPTDFRLFAGGTTAGNVFAVDNLYILEGAEYTTFGAGCPGALGVPTLAGGVLPKLGSTMTVNVGNLPLNLAIMISGLSNTLYAGAIPLPLSLASVGFPGCNLLVDLLTTETIVGAGGTATWSLAIPPSNPLLGFTLYNQAASLDPGAVFLSFSNGGRARIGI